MLTTDWIKVGTAGKTIDGREITPEMLSAAASAYSQDTYTANINSEHFFYPGLGHVVAVKATKDPQGRMALWVKLQPTAEFLTRNQDKRQLFYSMELRQDFPNDGDWYLTGLAITDTPASQGLAPHEFAAQEDARLREQKAWRYHYTAGFNRDQAGRWTEIDMHAEHPPAPQVPNPSDEPPGWFRNFWERIKTQFAAGETSPLNMEQEPMTEQERAEIEALKGQFTELKASLEALTQQLTAAAPAGAPPAAVAATPDGGTPAATPAPGVAASKEGDELTHIKATLTELQTKLTAFDAFMDETRATEQLEVTRTAEGAPVIW